MPLRHFMPLVPIGLLVAASSAPAVLASTGFTYQGQLRDGSAPVTANCDFLFSLFDAGLAGTQLGPTQTLTNVGVANGHFTVILNDTGQFGARAFDGSARWLAVVVRCPTGEGSYTPLTPRQPLTAAPLALALPGLRTEPNATSPNVVGGHIGNTVGVSVIGATIGGGGFTGQVNAVGANYGTVGGGVSNRANGNYATVSGGANNTAASAHTTVGGGTGNSATGGQSTVGGGSNNTASGVVATVGGGLVNSASGPGATVGGGGWDGTGGAGNLAAGDASTVGGGLGNQATAAADYGTIGGGYFNVASGVGATVGGGGWDGVLGNGNDATGRASAIGGGLDNTASGRAATVGGGQSNTASADHATVVGGFNNSASGEASLAAGRNADAAHSGSFVWNCIGCLPSSSGAGDQFVVNAAGGLWFGNGGSGPGGAIPAAQLISTSSGAYLSTAGVWTDVSDRNVKTAFAPVDGPGLLDMLMALPINSWRYTVDGAGVRHIGPTAQDFHAAFGLGADNTHLAPLDTSGVALAAIQGMYGVVQEKDAEIGALQASQAELRARVVALEAGKEAASGRSPVRLPWLLLGGLGLLNVGGLAGHALARAKRR
jgi:trimeric autotransporter adhesin